MVTKEKPPTLNPARSYDFWKSHGGVGLVWSNPDASDTVMIAHALLRPSFHRLLDIAVEFGLERLKAEWEGLQADFLIRSYPEELKQISHARPIVERCLRNITKGFQDAA